MQTSSVGASVTYTVQTSNPGQYVAVVVAKAANRGRATITVDGAGAGTIDTYAATSTNRVIGWQTRLATAGTHTIKITNQATAGRPRIDIDSVLLSPFTGHASESDS
jgi:threonine/homoserine/homoserine lactone efflux protein